MKIVVKTFWPGVVAFAAATVLFCLPGNEFPKNDWFSKIFLDKWIHVGLFATLVSLWCLPFVSKKRGARNLSHIFVWIAIGFIAYGVMIEFIQDKYVPNRSFGVDDMIADSIGSAIGVMFSSWQRKIQNQSN